MFQSFYFSIWQQPLLLWIPQIIFLIWLLKRGIFDTVSKLGIILTLISFFDAWLTTPAILGIGPVSPTLNTALSTFFVILGDFRYFFVSYILTRTRHPLIKSLGWSLVVPTLTFFFRHKFGLEDRPLYLTYELLFMGLVGVFFLSLKRKTSAVISKMTLYVAAYYFLWALADILILSSLIEPGFALRLIPNLMYYGFWAPVLVILSRAGSEAKNLKSTSPLSASQ